MDLQQPTNKMSKSVDSPQGTVLVLDDPKVIEKKIKRAVTDTDNEVRFDVVSQGRRVEPAVDPRRGHRHVTPRRLADDYDMYGPLKADCAEAVVELLRPIQARYAELVDDPSATTEILRVGAEKAGAIAARTLDRAQRAAGLLAPA